MKKKNWLRLGAVLLTSSMIGVVMADDDHDVEGVIDGVDAVTQTVSMGGVSYYLTPSTDYDDDLKTFNDLREGQRVEIDYVEREGRRIVKEIELDD